MPSTLTFMPGTVKPRFVLLGDIKINGRMLKVWIATPLRGSRRRVEIALGKYDIAHWVQRHAGG